jgi:aspartyl-tRNA(Asn)/glutamyl-tRNA(Gln) amidotransferase subunit B
LSPYDAGVLTLQGRTLVAYFEEVAQRCGDAKAACNWITNRLLASLNEKKEDFPTFLSHTELTAERLAGLIAEQKAVGLNKQAAEEVYNRMIQARIDAKTAIGQLGIKAVDAGALGEIVRRAIAANAKAVADYKAGKTKAAQAIKGAVMRETKGAARPEVVEQLILEEIQKET